MTTDDDGTGHDRARPARFDGRLPVRRNPEVDKLVERQSTESDIEKRKRLVWEIERKLAEDDARPILFYLLVWTAPNGIKRARMRSL
jgi:peptide/nickel transport system substrate-binding protein